MVEKKPKVLVNENARHWRKEKECGFIMVNIKRVIGPF